jgi:alkanesulfonate monooxygenase SsuD/methylene tetrahydromethanopterin reductase-like flavin-dependent oxidoreductase (luciferase family)
VIFGVARGYHTREVESFGNPLIDQDANREMFEEGVDVCFKAFNNEFFSHKGRFWTIPPEVPYRGYTLREISLVPRPERLPVECWQPIQSGSDRAFDFMAKHGICGVIGGGSAEGGAVDRHMEGFRAAYARRGVNLKPGERLSLGYQFHIAANQNEAIDRARVYYEENMKMFGELRLVRALTEEQIAAMRDPKLADSVKLPSIEDAVKAGGFLAGTPGQIIDELRRVEARFPGLERVSCSMPLGTPLKVALEQLTMFANEVMPAFKQNQAAAAQ